MDQPPLHHLQEWNSTLVLSPCIGWHVLSLSEGCVVVLLCEILPVLCQYWHCVCNFCVLCNSFYRMRMTVIVTMMRMIEVVTTTLIITIVKLKKVQLFQFS